MRWPEPSPPAFAIRLNLCLCGLGLVAAVLNILAGQWMTVTVNAVGAGFSAGLAAYIRARAQRDELEQEKLRAEIRATTYMAAITEAQHAAVTGAFTPERRH